MAVDLSYRHAAMSSILIFMLPIIVSICAVFSYITHQGKNITTFTIRPPCDPIL